MHSNDYALAVDFADCKQREADEQGKRDYTFKVVQFPSNFKFEPDDIKAFLNDVERNKRLDKDVN